MRVTFVPDEDQKVVFSIRNRVVDVVNDAEERKNSPRRGGRIRPPKDPDFGWPAVHRCDEGTPSPVYWNQDFGDKFLQSLEP